MKKGSHRCFSEEEAEVRMGMTMSQKILAKHAGLLSVLPGQLIEAAVDLVHGNDITTPLAIREGKGGAGDGPFCAE